MSRVADSSFLYALFDEDDDHHVKAKKDFAQPDPIEIPSEILVETANLLQRRLGFRFASNAIAYLLVKPHVRLAKQIDIQAARRMYERGQGALSLADGVVIQTCRALAVDPLSYDGAILDALR